MLSPFIHSRTANTAPLSVDTDMVSIDPLPAIKSSAAAVSSPSLSSVPSLEDLTQAEQELPVASDSDFAGFGSPFLPAMSNNNSIASVTAILKSILLLTSGKIQPEVLADWVHCCHQYFKINRKLLPADYVPTAATGLQDLLVSDWYMMDSDTFDELNFDIFIGLLRKHWLKSGWEDDIDWVISLKKKNTLLKGNFSYFDNTCLCAHLTANTVEDVYEAANHDSIKSIHYFKEWKETLGCVDTQCLKDHAHINAYINLALATQGNMC
ncbi:hypothetical protein QCA50_007313 [Cerrena zonata]|uniref:Uncharacterized protein n=1 Tax=Cerrena zonata TaxID=2478898 RepID=A0AAW0GJ70_9APHY